jgi:hypothetical protein
LYAVTGTAASPSYTAIASTTAFVPTVAAAESFAFKATLFGNTASGVLGGSYAAYVQGALNNSTPKNTDATITGLDFAAGNSGLRQGAVLGFAMGVTFGTSDATNTASLTQFNIKS